MTLRLGVIHAMGNDTTLPSRGKSLRAIGKSLECLHVSFDDFEVAEATYRGALAIRAHYGRAADKPRVFLNVASRIEL